MGFFDRFKKKENQEEYLESKLKDRQDKAEENFKRLEQNKTESDARVESILNGEAAQTITRDSVLFAEQILRDEEARKQREEEAFKIGQAMADKLKRKEEEKKQKTQDLMAQSKMNVEEESKEPKKISTETIASPEVKHSNTEIKKDNKIKQKANSYQYQPNKTFEPNIEKMDLYCNNTNRSYYLKGTTINNFIDSDLKSNLFYPVDIHQLNLENFNLITKQLSGREIVQLINDAKLEANYGRYLMEFYASNVHQKSVFPYLGEEKFHETMNAFYEKMNGKEKGRH